MPRVLSLNETFFLFRDAVIVLGAALNRDVSDEVFYGIGTLYTESAEPPVSFLSFTVPQFRNVYTVRFSTV